MLFLFEDSFQELDIIEVALDGLEVSLDFVVQDLESLLVAERRVSFWGIEGLREELLVGVGEAVV